MGRKLNKILGTILLAGASLFPLKAQNPAERHMINPFNQPNDTSLNYYGSGDVNNDGKIDNKDLATISLMPWKNVPSDTTDRKFDRADVNGDGKIDGNDIAAINGYVYYKDSTGLPGRFWNYLNKADKLKWAKKMAQADSAYRLNNPFPAGWICTQMGEQTEINFYGYGKINSFEDYNFDNNGRYNLPVYKASIPNIPGGHLANSILIGKNPKEFEDWFYFDPANWYHELKPGNGRMPANSDIQLQHDFDTINCSTFDEFQLDSLNPKFVSYSPQTLILTNPITDKNPPIVELTGLENNQHYSYFLTQAICNIHDGEFVSDTALNIGTFDVYDGTFLDSCWYKLNDGAKTEIPYYIKYFSTDFATYSTSDTIDLAGKLHEGKNTLIIYRSDIAGNKKTDTTIFNVDTTVDSIKKPVFEAVSVYPEFSVYPNPVTNKLKVKGLEKGVIDIYDISGRKLKEFNYRENEEIDFSNYARGIYIIKAENSEGKSLTKKVIKQ